jgi:hypothetical protein
MEKILAKAIGIPAGLAGGFGFAPTRKPTLLQIRSIREYL